MHPAAPFALLLSVLCAAVSADKVAVHLQPKVDSTYKTKLRLESSINGGDLVATASLLTKVKSVDKDKIVLSTTWKDIEVQVAGAEQPVSGDDMTIEMKPTGAIQKVSGGMQMTDAARMLLITQFLPPTNEIGEGEKYTFDLAEIKDAVPAFHYEGTYVGKADYKGKPALKFQAKYTEPGNEPVKAEMTFLVLEDGSVLQATSTFKNLPIPGVGTSIDGKMTLDSANE